MQKNVFQICLSLVLVLNCCSALFGQSNPPLFSVKKAKNKSICFKNSNEELILSNSNSPLIFMGGGVGIGDFDNDGFQDIFFTHSEGNDALYRNKGKFIFENVTQSAHIQTNYSWHTGVSIIDINADGYLDIYVSSNWIIDNGEINQNPNLLYINNHDFTFTESAAEYGIADTGPSIQSVFFDVDLDGDLDLYVVNNPTSISDFKDMTVPASSDFSDHFYINEDGKFSNQNNSFGIGGYSAGLGVWVDDVNGDNYPDIYVSNDFNKRDFLFINNNGKDFTESIKDKTNHISQFGMGTDFGDFNNDGYQDIFSLDMSLEDRFAAKINMPSMDPKTFNNLVAKGEHYQYMHNTLQLNNQNGSYSEISSLTHTAKSDWSWSTLIADFDLDGNQDIAITNGPFRDINNRDLIQKVNDSLETNWNQSVLIEMAKPISAKNKFYQNHGRLDFSDKSQEWGFTESDNSNGMAYADVDNDGDLDLVINRLNARALIYENNSYKKEYISFEIKGEHQNTFGLGTQVSIYQGENIQSKVLSPVRGFISSVDYRINFGGVSKSNIDSILIEKPTGETFKLTVFELNSNNIIELSQYQGKENKVQSKKTLFTEKSTEFYHRENKFDDYEREILLPYGYSNLGPGLKAVSASEFIVTGAIGQESALYQINNGQVILQQNLGIKNAEIVNVIALENNQTLLISGGNEAEENDPVYRDILINKDGKQTFFDSLNTSSSKVAVTGDFDNDGDNDLFIGGRVSPGQFPKAPRSYLYLNDNGVYTDATQEICPELAQIGMITAAEFNDYNGDGKIDLLLLGEYMAPTLFINNNNKLEVSNTIAEYQGVWMSAKSIDLDNDGDLDFIAGNLGMNTKFKASVDQPFNIYGHDFDKNGTMDIVLSTFYDSIEYPVRGKECSTQQMPFVSEKFPTYDLFASASTKDIYAENLDEAIHLSAHTFETSAFINDGNGNFNRLVLPVETQFSSVNTIEFIDYDKDGFQDILLFGNWHNVEIETTRFDASYGMLLHNNGDLTFTPIAPKESGIHINGVVNSSTQTHKDGKTTILLGINNGAMKILELN